MAAAEKLSRGTVAANFLHSLESPIKALEITKQIHGAVRGHGARMLTCPGSQRSASRYSSHSGCSEGMAALARPAAQFHSYRCWNRRMETKTISSALLLRFRFVSTPHKWLTHTPQLLQSVKGNPHIVQFLGAFRSASSSAETSMNAG